MGTALFRLQVHWVVAPLVLTVAIPESVYRVLQVLRVCVSMGQKGKKNFVVVDDRILTLPGTVPGTVPPVLQIS